MAILDIQPAYREALEAAGLAAFEALYAAAGACIVDGHRQRSVSRLELARPGAEPLVLYVKRRWGEAAQAPWTALLRGRWPKPPAAREWANLRALAEAGGHVADPVAHGRTEGAGGPRSLLAVRAVEGPSLAAWLHTEGPRERPEAMRRVAVAVGRAVRGLHDAGFVYRDLYAKHLFLEELDAAAGPRVVFIDAQRLGRRTRRRARKDLARLYATTLVPGVRPVDRLRMLRAYLGERWSRPEARGLIERVLREAHRVAERGRDPHLIAERRTAPPGMVPLADETMAVVDGGRLRINEAFRGHLEAAGLVTLDALMAHGGEVFREKDGRSTVRAELPSLGDKPVAVYLKRYTRVPPRLALRRTISLGEPTSQAVEEMKQIVRVTEAGVPTMRIVAVGEALAHGGRTERSCLVTEEVPGATQADVHAEARFAPPADPGRTREKRQLLRSMGELVRRFHRAGFVHRDLYLCHILIRKTGGEPVLHLIDLGRVGRPRGWRRRRGIVKDLAALLFSSWPSEATWVRSRVFTDTDRMRFARAYLGGRLTPEAKAWLRRVVRRARRVARREARRGGAAPPPD